MATDTVIKLKFRAPGGSAGAPSALKTAEQAYNMSDGNLYIGYGDDGSGNATSVRIIGNDQFSIVKLLPSGGTTGQVLKKVSGTDYDVEWDDETGGGGPTYTAGYGIIIDADEISVDDAVFATIEYVDDALDTATFDASQITTGVFDPARIPVIHVNNYVVSSGGIADLTSPQQDEIVEGTVVITTDGRRWIYTGTGSKTSEASYIELADVTPDWSTIANKPDFADVATSGDYNDLDNLPTLGTMAAQNANSVAITGGTVAGVTISGSFISGGTF